MAKTIKLYGFVGVGVKVLDALVENKKLLHRYLEKILAEKLRILAENIRISILVELVGDPLGDRLAPSLQLQIVLCRCCLWD